jgi:selenocysteine-specific elongation factor
LRVVGTAGHVDHGKSTLVQALTGTHPDRLQEEIAREMTIDLGFAWWELPSGEEVGVVDVPGHKDFIENMLSGVGGIDAVIFVIAADEGVMPQTLEHLAILDILKIQAGVIALTKIDLVDDPDWIPLVKQEIRETVEGTVLEKVKIISVSAVKKEGLDELQAELDTLLKESPKRQDLARPRLPIDRVFTMPGYGTVVTGTLLDGRLSVGDEIKISPSGKKGRIRGIQNHKKSAEFATPGTRTAINISGLKVDEIERGQVVTHPQVELKTNRLDVYFKSSPNISSPIKHNMTVKFFAGAAEVVGRVRLLGVEEIGVDQSGWMQIYLNLPVSITNGDRYIIRRPSPSETLGGGVVLDTNPQARHKRFDAKIIEHLQTLLEGTPQDLIRSQMANVDFISAKNLNEIMSFPANEFENLIGEMIETGIIQKLGEGSLTAKKTNLILNSKWEASMILLINLLSQYHLNKPLHLGMQKELLKTKSSIPQIVFDHLITQLTQLDQIIQSGPLIRLQGHQVVLTEVQEKGKNSYFAKFVGNSFSPPNVKEGIETLGDDLFYALVEMGELRMLSETIVFLETDYRKAENDVLEKIAKNGSITLGEMRDDWQTSRKYVQALLEYMDAQKITKRQGDGRIKF